MPKSAQKSDASNGAKSVAVAEPAARKPEKRSRSARKPIDGAVKAAEPGAGDPVAATAKPRRAASKGADGKVPDRSLEKGAMKTAEAASKAPKAPAKAASKGTVKAAAAPAPKPAAPKPAAAVAPSAPAKAAVSAPQKAANRTFGAVIETVVERAPRRVPGSTRYIVAAPIETPRFGRTLVIDMSAPQQAMTARRNLSLPRASLIVTSAAREIIALSREGLKLDTIAVVGSDTDPSAHPDLREITENLRALRDKHLARAKLRVFTATRDLSSYELRSTLAMYDRVHLELEWGTAKVFSAVTGEKGPALTSLIKFASSFDHLVVEANFFRGSDDRDNSTDSEVKLWIKKLVEVKPQEVHILAGLGSGKDVPKVKAVPKARRDEIAEEVAEKTGLSVAVYEDGPLLEH